MLPNNSNSNTALSSLELEKMKKDNALKAALASLQADIAKKNEATAQSAGGVSSSPTGNSVPSKG